jgi:hypothetical protein
MLTPMPPDHIAATGIIVSLQICAAILQFCRNQTPLQQFACPSKSDMCV